MKVKNSVLLVLLILLVVVSICVTSGIGAVSISFPEVFDIIGYKLGIVSENAIDQRIAAVWTNIRFPRVLLSVLVGGALSYSGATMQGLFRNPLADPSIIGISLGAAAMAAITIVIIAPLMQAYQFFGLSILSVTTFVGAAGVALFIYRIARTNGKTSVSTMLLAGIAINAISGAITGILTYMADESQLRDLTFWTLGSLGGANYTNVIIVAIALTIALVMLLPETKSFNALALGEQEAKLIGTNTEKLKNKVIFTTALIVGVSVAFTGMIGFVGLVIPHIIRLAGGSDHRFVLPASLLGGALLLNVGDTIARTVIAPTELPIGIITSVVGAPSFLMLLLHRKKTLGI